MDLLNLHVVCRIDWEIAGLPVVVVVVVVEQCSKKKNIKHKFEIFVDFYLYTKKGFG
jgi:hypothetical protein